MPNITEVIGAILAIPAIRGMIEDVAMRAIADIFHRRSVDPNFLTKSDAAFAQLSAAKTPEETTNAQLLLRNLMASD